MHLKVESECEKIRKRVDYSTLDAFKSCDINNDGIVTKKEIERLLDSKGVHAN
jgi:Ca2+-binding EF-hand superfamily protein